MKEDDSMAKPKLLPSGKWRIRIYDNDLKKQISFTSTQEGRLGKAEVELAASEYLLGKKQKLKTGKTVGECIDEYIDSKENVLSPTTINSYRRNKINNLFELCDILLSQLKESDIQKHINKLSLSKSPKTVRCAYGLLTATLNIFAPEMVLRVTLPKPIKHIKQLPTAENVLKTIIGTEIELPCMLAMWLGLRMSEIRGLKKSDIKENVLTIHSVIVTVNGEHIEKKHTKTVESTRQVEIPEYIMDLINKLPEEQEYLTTLSGQALYKRFTRLLKNNGIEEHMTFHDLRHMNASIMLALGVPDKYAMERGGWSSPNIMKSVYQHTFSKERRAVDKKIDEHFGGMLKSILDTKLDTTQ